jgi:hypothetical protein
MRSLALLVLSACGSGTWVVETWGEEYIEYTIPAADFADGCAVTYGFGELDTLREGSGDVFGVGRRHRLKTNRIRSTDADITYLDDAGEASHGLMSGMTVGQRH